LKPLAQQMVYYHEHPPSCLKGFAARPAVVPGMGFDGHAGTGSFADELVPNPNVVFGLRCPCGGDVFLLGNNAGTYDISYYKTLVLAENYDATCWACGKKTPLFDSSLHGYDAEVMRLEGNTYSRGEGQSDEGHLAGPTTVACQCGNCKSHMLKVIVRLEYPSDLFEDAFFAGREEEFFSWFTVVGECTQCAALTTMVDAECA
jgi:hypothetical protein